MATEEFGQLTPNADDQFENYLYFDFDEQVLKFNYNWIDNPNDNGGPLVVFSRESLK